MALWLCGESPAIKLNSTSPATGVSSSLLDRANTENAGGGGDVLREIREDEDGDDVEEEEEEDVFEDYGETDEDYDEEEDEEEEDETSYEYYDSQEAREEQEIHSALLVRGKKRTASHEENAV